MTMVTTETTPKRLQRQRIHGCTMPAGARYCGRPGMFGNPFKFGTYQALARVPAADGVTPWEYEGRISADGAWHDMVWPGGEVSHHQIRYMTRDEIVATHRRALIAPTGGLHLSHRSRSRPATTITVDVVRRELAGLNLSCWCRLDDACHVDTLLWVANAREAEIKAAAVAEYEIMRESAQRVFVLHPEVHRAA